MRKKYKRFCINCGKTGFSKEQLIEGRCFDCYKLKNPIISLKEQPIIYLCKECFSIKITKDWIKTTPLNFFKQANHLLNQNVNFYFKISPNITINLKLDESLDIRDLLQYNTINFNINYHGKIQNLFEVNENQTYTLKIKSDICNNCKAYKSNISKSKIRIIAKKRNITEFEIEEIIKIIENSANIYKDPNLYVLPPVIAKTELIFRFSSIDFARDIAHQIRKKFGAVLRESFKFVDKERSKTKKKDVNILIRLLPFFPGDIIRYDNILLYVISINDSIINCYDFKAKEIKKFKSKQLISGKKYLPKAKLKKFIVTAIYKDTIQIMDLNTYQTFEFEIRNEFYRKRIKEGAELKGFREGENLNLIPFIIQGSDIKYD